MVILKPEIVAWYARRGKDISKQIEPHRMPTGVLREQVEVAAIEYYNGVASDDFEARRLVLKNGKERKYLDIVQDVYEIAKEIKAVEYIEGHQKAYQTSEIINKMDDKHRAFADKMNASVARLKRERRALAVALWCWLIWEIYRAIGGCS